MTQLTHQNARHLLQKSLDAELNPPDKILLAGHMSACPECNAYAQNISNLETQLRRLTHQQWDRHAPRFSAQSIQRRAAVPAKTNPFQNLGLAVKFAAAAALVIILMFAFNLGGLQKFNPLPADVSSAPAPATALQTPTPSIRETSTQASQPNCQFATHIVRENETLDEIAARYSVSTIRLMEVNSLRNNPLTPGMALSIPVCVTPTSTFTTTPWLGSASPTPRD